MRLVHPSRTIAIRLWGDPDRAREATADCVRIVPDIPDRDAPALELTVEQDGLSRGIVVGADAAGGAPLILGTEWAGSLWLAQGRYVYAVPEDPALTRWITLESPVMHIRLLVKHDLLIVVYETGITALEHDFSARWSIATDHIANFSWRRTEVISVEQMDGPGVAIAVLLFAQEEAVG